MSRELPPCDHDECPPSHCKRPGSLAAPHGSALAQRCEELKLLAKELASEAHHAGDNVTRWMMDAVLREIERVEARLKAQNDKR
jgi:DNA-binding ferritin-like protein